VPSWHSLSDPGLEQRLRVRLDFLRFTVFSVGDNLPDETRFCRFRNKLASQGKYEKLLKENNRQLESRGLKVKASPLAIVDAEGFIGKTHVTPANLAETKELETLLDGLKAGTRLAADKGFAGCANKRKLKERKLKNGLIYKAHRNKPLTERMKRFNKRVSRFRWRIEQNFGTLKRRFSFSKASYFTTEKVAAQFCMKAVCLNLLKAANKVRPA